MKVSIPKGLFDILPYGYGQDWQNIHYWQYVESVIYKLAADYGFSEIRTPVFEHADLFLRGVGSTSDIVNKEMYVFKDRKERLLALRPEGTSSIIRAFVEKSLFSLKKVHKFFYIAPMFRYERPQAGRYRQHHQFGVEAIGNFSAEQDAEIIDLLYELYQRLGLKKVKVWVNSLGDLPSREAYREALQNYFKPYFSDLSEESQIRFTKNPLRILDSKNPKDQPIVKDAPQLIDYLNDFSRNHFISLLSLLDRLEIPYEVNPRIVRGLDYYNHTVFEITSEELGAQNALGGGGRYDGFTSLFGGPSLPGIGFGTGLERILQALLSQKAKLPVSNIPSFLLVPLGEKAKQESLYLATQLRRCRLSCEVDLSEKKLKQSLSYASSQNIPYVVIMGENELSQKTLQLKNMKENKEEELSQESFLHRFCKEENSHV